MGSITPNIRNIDAVFNNTTPPNTRLAITYIWIPQRCQNHMAMPAITDARDDNPNRTSASDELSTDMERAIAQKINPWMTI